MPDVPDSAPMRPATTRDAFFGGRLMLTQTAAGHRSGSDAVLLAAAAPAGFAGLCHDVGAGVGAVGLGVALIHPEARVMLVEREPVALALAVDNAAPFGPRVGVVACDVLDPAALRAALPERADLVLTNPPYRDGRRHRLSPDALRRAAHAMDGEGDLAGWTAACLDRLADKGCLVMIHAASAVPDVLAALRGRAGNVCVKPVQPRAGAPAHRVLVRAVKGSRAPFALAAPLVLHEADGAFTQEAQRLHRGESILEW